MSSGIEIEDRDLREQIEGLKKENVILQGELKTLKNQLGRREYSRRELSVKVNCKTSRKSFTCFSRDISEGGIFIETDRKLAVGTEIYLTFELIPANPIDIKSYVIWSGSTGIGLKFEDSEQVLYKLKAMLNSANELKTILYQSEIEG